VGFTRIQPSYSSYISDMQCAPLWDPTQCQFVGLLTVTDFVDILRHYRSSGMDVADLAVHSIKDILVYATKQDAVRARGFRCADSNCTLKQACQLMLTNGQDYLPIVFADDMRVLSCMTYTNILEHLVTHFREQRRLFDDSIVDLKIGTYGDSLVSVTPNQTLSDALGLMKKHKLSALPVVDAGTHKIVGVYSRSDITFLTKAIDAEDAVRNLDMPLADILSQTRQDVTTPDALRTCSPSHTLQAIFESFAQLRFHRLYVVDTEERLVGIVSARDLVAYFLHDEDQA
jgi:5'-AMP-activated protein kinase, regulatory gamma subunit